MLCISIFLVADSLFVCMYCAYVRMGFVYMLVGSGIGRRRERNVSFCIERLYTYIIFKKMLKIVGKFYYYFEAFHCNDCAFRILYWLLFFNLPGILNSHHLSAKLAWQYTSYMLARGSSLV